MSLLISLFKVKSFGKTTPNCAVIFKFTKQLCFYDVKSRVEICHAIGETFREANNFTRVRKVPKIIFFNILLKFSKFFFEVNTLLTLQLM